MDFGEGNHLQVSVLKDPALCVEDPGFPRGDSTNPTPKVGVKPIYAMLLPELYL